MKRCSPAIAAVAMVVMLAACGNGADGADDDVASLGSTTTVAGDSVPAAEEEVDPEEAMLQYAQCMRDHGIDMPDPQMSSDGKGVIAITSEADVDEGGGGPAFSPDDEEFQAAQEECEPIMDDAIGSIEIDPEQQAEMREQLLDYAQCMRDQGVDFPDPTFSDDGRVTMGVGPDENGEPPSESEQDAMEEANEACATEGGPMAMPAGPIDAEEG